MWTHAGLAERPAFDLSGRGRHATARVAALAAAVAAALSVAAANATATPLISEFSTGLQMGNSSFPEDVAPGPDGNVWFTDDGTTKAVGRITPDGAITEFSTGLQMNSVPFYIARGPDGNMWFTDQGAKAIGRITPSGTITEFSTGLQAGSASVPQDITLGPDGNLWFTDRGATKEIGRITPSGTITEFSTGLPMGNTSDPYAIAPGPDGNVWFTDLATPAIGRITPSGTITEFTAGLQKGSFPNDIAPGPDGNMWFADRGGAINGPGPANEIGQITPSGTIVELSAGLQMGNASDPISITLGPDGNLWFTDQGATKEIGQITSSATITECSAGLQVGNASLPYDIAPGPDGNLWFTDQGATAAIGRLALQSPAVTTGAAGAITSSGAIVVGTVNPNFGAVRAISVQYGATTAYGSTVATSPGALPAGCAAAPVSATLSGLPAGTTIHYRLVATNAYGTSPGADQTLTTIAATTTTTTATPMPGSTPTPSLTPTISGARQSHSTWREGDRLATFAKTRRKLPVGTTFSFTLNEPALVKLTFNQAANGRKVKRACVPQTSKNRSKPACRRMITRGTLSFRGHAGLNKVSFQGRISASRKLPTGSYTLVIAAAAAGRSSAPTTLRFTIARK